jgi:hypothetical protein
MWSKKQQLEVNSEFFEGLSFVKNAVNSMYGLFMTAINNVNIDIKELAVPKIIVIGNESSGKSSLLENIIKCQIFPKNATFGTKQPIHLILKPTSITEEITYRVIYKNSVIVTSKKLIYQEVQKIMNCVNEDILEDEILIEITDINMVNFEFYDIPGIRAYPPDLEMKTKKLAEKYLSLENVIPICVIPATTPRITSYVPLGIIKKFNKEASTLICLTMCDRLQEENIEELLIKRITNNTDEYESNDYAGCVAIINRSHKNTISLSESDNTENKWFTHNIVNNIPKNFPSKDKILNNITLTNLIQNLDIVYNNFVKTKWIPNTLTKLNNDKTILQNELKILGFEPSNIEEKNNFKIFVETVLLDEIFKLHNYYANSKLYNNTYDFNNFTDDKIDITDFNINEIIEVKFNKENIIKKLMENNYPEHPERFDKFISYLVNFIQGNYNTELEEIMDIHKNNIVYDYMSNSFEDFKNKMKRFATKTNSIIMTNIFSHVYNYFHIDETFINLVENDNYANRRKNLNNKIEDITKAIYQINTLNSK